tara:strand:+ start:743 stop:1111 length:369 start_codon:yes stop_codon:yes gene_type:complete
MKIDLTEREVNLILSCIDTNIETIKRRADVSKGEVADLLQELAEMDMDIREQAFRGDSDGWNTDDSTAFVVAEDDFIKQGMDAAEKAKSNRIAVSSRAQERRNARMLHGTVTANISNDPVDW